MLHYQNVRTRLREFIAEAFSVPDQRILAHDLGEKPGTIYWEQPARNTAHDLVIWLYRNGVSIDKVLAQLKAERPWRHDEIDAIIVLEPEELESAETHATARKDCAPPTLRSPR